MPAGIAALYEAQSEDKFKKAMQSAAEKAAKTSWVRDKHVHDFYNILRSIGEIGEKVLNETDLISKLNEWEVSIETLNTGDNHYSTSSPFSDRLFGKRQPQDTPAPPEPRM